MDMSEHAGGLACRFNELITGFLKQHGASNVGKRGEAWLTDLRRTFEEAIRMKALLALKDNATTFTYFPYDTNCDNRMVGIHGSIIPPRSKVLLTLSPGIISHGSGPAGADEILLRAEVYWQKDFDAIPKSHVSDSEE